ncbi:two-component system chemotaxis sensor kinase CheA [Orenia metallireducens]|uniref:histidine kinase n=1 Tax=Orenia metallireducens TaxID=1413210 RepID=A0A285HNZ5_9FIRM|nr:ATP-binding protein [Orenia metallireducens]PRX27984.1 two-component system chemotaxis sensor kinase CheA [Orenia metallireducens]SNY37449.1 two-component system, chemotaxis family, sensor kinase CheA [Orenia metallireducens]
MNKRYLILIVLIFIVSITSKIEGKEVLSDSSQFFKEGWEYKVGDDKWADFKHGLKLGSENREFIWLKHKFPQGQFKDPCLVFNSVEYDFDIYLGGKLIYKSDNQIAYQYRQGIVNHIIDLPQNFDNKSLYIKIYPGVFGFKTIDSFFLKLTEVNSKDNYYHNLIYEHLFDIFFGSTAIVIGWIILIIYLFIRFIERRVVKGKFIFIGIFSWGLGLFSLFPIALTFSNQSIYLYYMLLSVPMIIIGIAIGLIEILKVKVEDDCFSIKNLRFVKRVHQFLLVIVFFFDLLQIKSIYEFDNLYLGILVLTILNIIIIVILEAIEGIKEFKVIAFSILLGLLLESIIMIVNHKELALSFKMPNSISLAFLISLIINAVMEYLEVHKQLEGYSQNLEEKIAAKTVDIRNLLNNVGQGFLSFGKSLTINEEYSRECLNIFNKEIGGMNIVELLFKQEGQREFLRDILRTIFSSQDQDDIKMYLPLLPEESKIADKYIDLNFKLIGENTKEAGSREMMLVLTDISDKKELESKVEEERNNLKMAVNVVVNFNDFIELKNSYLDFFNSEVEEMVASGISIQDLLSRIYLQIHNFKGDFSQLGMNNTVNSLHCFEGKLLELKDKLYEESVEITELRRLIKEEEAVGFLSQDLDILQELLGDYILEQNKKIIIEISKLKMIEKRVVELLAPKDSEKLLVELKRLRYKPFKEILKFYPDYMQELGGRLGKLIKPVKIVGGKELVDLEDYNELGKSLVHLFRNSIDHGIEEPEQRVAKGKSKYGEIICEIEMEEDKIIIKVSDDGKGINIAKIKEHALKEGLYSAKELNNLSQQEILSIIFSEGLSTKKNVTELSGRGVGLAAVKEAVERLSGSIKIYTTLDKGTEFQLIVPRNY